MRVLKTACDSNFREIWHLWPLRASALTCAHPHTHRYTHICMVKTNKKKSFFNKGARLDYLVFRRRAGPWTPPLDFKPWQNEAVWYTTLSSCYQSSVFRAPPAHVLWPSTGPYRNKVLSSRHGQLLTSLNLAQSLTRGGRWLERGRERCPNLTPAIGFHIPATKWLTLRKMRVMYSLATWALFESPWTPSSPSKPAF